MISILVPSRGRPERLKELEITVYDTVRDIHGVEIILRLDEDDPQRDAYPELGMWTRGRILTGKRLPLSSLWNECWQAAQGPIYMLGADDVRFRTLYWDQRVWGAFQKYPDRIAHVFGHGPDEDPDFGTHGFLHKNWTDTVGYFTPHGFGCDFVDSWLNNVAWMIGRQQPVDIEVEHMHPSHGKAEMDDTYRHGQIQRPLARKLWEATRNDRRNDAFKLSERIIELA